jgi:hypothetical protein
VTETVVVIVLDAFRFATVKLAVMVLLAVMLNVRLSGVRIKGCLIEVEVMGKRAGRKIMIPIITTSSRNAHIGTGRRRKLGLFSSIGEAPG